MNTTLADFCARERQRVIDFTEWYIQQYRVEPENFPLDMPLGMWEEQIQIWDEGNG